MGGRHRDRDPLRVIVWVVWLLCVLLAATLLLCVRLDWPPNFWGTS